MAVNKVNFGNETLMDISDSTVTEDNLLNGEKAYGADGKPVTGKVDVPNICICKCDSIAADSRKVIVPIEGQSFQFKKGSIIAVRFKYTNKSTNIEFEIEENQYPIFVSGRIYEGNSPLYTGDAGGYIYYMYDGWGWGWLSSGINPSTSVYVNTNGSDSAKIGISNNFILKEKSYIQIFLEHSNTSKTFLFLNINNTGSKSIYINDELASNTNYELPGGLYIVYYDGTYYYFRTDGKIPNVGGQNDIDLSIVDGALNQTYDESGEGNTETTNPIVLDSTAKESVSLLQRIALALESKPKELTDVLKEKIRTWLFSDLVTDSLAVGTKGQSIADSKAVSELNNKLGEEVIYATIEFGSDEAKYSSGTIGTRGVQLIKSLNDYTDQGYEPISATICYTRNSEAYIPIVMLYDTNRTLILNLYRSNTSAISDATTRVRVAFKKL